MAVAAGDGRDPRPLWPSEVRAGSAAVIRGSMDPQITAAWIDLAMAGSIHAGAWAGVAEDAWKAGKGHGRRERGRLRAGGPEALTDP